ncbi:MAG: hypothetical protein ACRD19_14595, partial [Terriglobia bacterium]
MRRLALDSPLTGDVASRANRIVERSGRLRLLENRRYRMLGAGENKFSAMMVQLQHKKQVQL